MRAFFLALLTLLMLPLAALAQSSDRPNTILVLDGSGSMWGQIDGVNKIVIARNVIADMLDEMADDVSLGLTVYGHRQRGSCTDIETIVEPAPFTQDRILEAVNAINPRGRTPMTDAVIAAAQSLRHTEEAATVILVSDGIENCNPDPCAIAAELEASGVAFTAHVIGFDVASEPEARAQMQCIADNTGGQFLTADNAAELSAALNQVVEVVMPVQTTLEAVVVPQMVPPTRPVTWVILDATGAPLTRGVTAPAIQAELMPGDYIAQATRAEPAGPATYQTAFSVLEGGQPPVRVEMPAIVETSPLTFSARVEPDMSVPASALNWTLFDASGTAIFGPVTAPGGNVALLPGDYRIEVERVSTGTRHDATFTMQANTPQDVVIPLPALLVDITFVARIGDVGGLPVTDPVVWQVTPLDPAPVIATTNPATLPLSRGAYRVTAYWTVQEIEQSTDFVVVDQPREIVVVFDAPPLQATLTAPETAVAGSTIEVSWTGPAAESDFIAFARDTSGVYGTYAFTRDGNPSEIRVPSQPGDYLLIYMSSGSGSREIIGTLPITVTPAQATLTAPETALAGSTIEVGWTGPDYAPDFIAIAEPGATSHINHTLTREGSPLRLQMPTEVGTYEIRYAMQVDREVIATRSIEVTDIAATIIAPQTAVAGSTIEVGWTGPDYELDYIGIGMPDRNGDPTWENFTYTRDGSPLRLLVPTEPGDYLISYLIQQDRRVLVSVPISVTPAAATVTAPTSAVAGSTIEVAWTGPDYELDYIGIGRVDRDGNPTWENFTYTRDGTPLRLLVPTEPGEYQISYFMQQDRHVLVSVPISVTGAQATVTAPTSAVAGSTIEVAWTGPDEAQDYIGIGMPDRDGDPTWQNYTYTRDGNPLRLLVPTEPGEYQVTYFLQQDRTPLVSVPITVTAAQATLTVPASAIAGSTVEIGWTGPDYAQDYIGIGMPDRDGDPTWENYTYTREGNPLRLVMPTEPGDYLVTYFLQQDRVPLVSVPLSVTDATATITAPPSAVAGSTIEVGWTGPDYAQDFIGIGRAGETGGDQWQNYTRTDEGSPLRLLTPPEAGTYVIRYFLNQDRVALAEAEITLSAPEATITAPATAPVGSTVEVGWTGPDYHHDFIAIGLSGATGGGQWENYTRTDDGNPLRLLMPTEPGDYVIRYIMEQDRLTIAEAPITLTDVAATLSAPDAAPAGGTIQVEWTGPDYLHDFIGLGLAGADGGGQWQSYTRTDQGSPLTLDVPDEPGSYVLRYFMEQDRRVIAERPITVQ